MVPDNELSQCKLAIIVVNSKKKGVEEPEIGNEQFWHPDSGSYPSQNFKIHLL